MNGGSTIATIRRNALRSLIPPPRVALSRWIEENNRLEVARRGRVRPNRYALSTAAKVEAA